MDTGEQASSDGGQDQGSAFDSLEAAGDALTDVLNPSNEEQPLDNSDADADFQNQGGRDDDLEDKEASDDNQDDQDDDDQDDDDEYDLDDLDLDDDASDEDGKEEPMYKVGDEELTVKQLQEGYMRSSDYTKKTEAVAAERKMFEQDRKVYSETTAQTKAFYDVVVDYVRNNLIHPKPDPSMAYQDPQGYAQDLALHDQTLNEANKLFQASQIATQNMNTQDQQISELQGQRQYEAEISKIRDIYPQLREPAKLQKFEASINEFASEMGFNEQDIAQQSNDHRVMQVLHLAKIGKKALENRRSAKQKMGEKPIGRGSSRVSKKEYRNTKQRNNMKRLSKTGSVQDAGSVLGEMLLRQ